MKITVLGGGSWGGALALAAYRANNQVSIWSRSDAISSEINTLHSNNKYLPGIRIPESIVAFSEFKNIKQSDALIIAIPAQKIRELCKQLTKINLSNKAILIICSKGIEQNSLKLMSEVIEEILPNNPIAILSGPNFALEVANNLPAITSISSGNINLANELSYKLASPNFRIYPNKDIIGTQIIGAAKNVLAIATGITIGKNLGENAKSAIFSRGIYEINNLLLAKRGKTETLLSPAGIGDLNLTCSSLTSRNTTYGMLIAQGNHSSNTSLVEGFYTAESIFMLAKKLEVEMPIAETIYQVTHKNLPLDIAIENLLKRSVISL